MASKTWKICCLILLFAALLFSFASTQENSLPVLKAKTKTVAVFKNGLGFFTREGLSELKDGWAVTEHVPPSSLGSVWVSSLDKDSRLAEVIGFREDVRKAAEAISIEELLEANIGEKVNITYGDNKTIEGAIKSVPKTREPEKADLIPTDYTRNIYDPRLQPKPGLIVVIDTGSSEVVLNKASITKVEFNGEFSTAFPGREKAKRLKFRVATPKKEAKIALSYLQKGISWSPAYLVNIEDPKKARITLKATLVNDAESIEDANVFFTVGYPNFIYADILSPMAMEESLTQFLQSLRREGRQDEAGLGAITRQRADFRYNDAMSSVDNNYEVMTAMPGAAEEDLFFYSKEAVSLKKGERAEYHIFSFEVDYMHVYEWEIPDTINVDLRGHQRTDLKKEEKEHVWHSIKLTNSTKFPWTTAPAFIVSGWRPLAQDTVRYTPGGVSTNLKMTVAADLSHERQELETERQRDQKIYNYSYDLVTVKGVLRIKNLKDREITMEIKKKMTGEVIEVSHSGKIEKVAEGLQGVNQNSSVSWKFPIKGGEEANVTYKYKVYIAR